MAHGQTLKARVQQAAELVGSLKLSVFRARLQFHAQRKKLATSRKPRSRTKREVPIAKVKLQARTEALNTAQKRFDALYNHAIGATTPKPRTGLADRNLTSVQTRGSSSFEDCIANLLASEPERVWSLDDILGRLPMISQASIRVLLYTLKRKGKAEKVGRGAWRAVAVG